MSELQRVIDRVTADFKNQTVRDALSADEYKGIPELIPISDVGQTLPDDNISDICDEDLKKIIDTVAALPKPQAHIPVINTNTFTDILSSWDTIGDYKHHSNGLNYDDSSEEYGDSNSTGYFISTPTIRDVMCELKILSSDVDKVNVIVSRLASTQARLVKDMIELRKQNERLQLDMQLMHSDVVGMCSSMRLLLDHVNKANL